MKKFIAFAPQQPEGNLKKSIYTAQDNSRLQYGETSFPIIPVMNGYLNAGDEFQLIVIVADYENTRRNAEHLKKEVEKLCREKEIAYDFHKNWKELIVPFDDGLQAQLEMFQKIIQEFEDGDEIYACITYGSKPAEIVELMALRYARKIKKNIYVGCVAYGQRDWETKSMKIYDLTALVHLDDMIQTVSEMDSENAERLLKNVMEE